MIKMRVCLLTETYYPVVGGGETQTRNLAEGLVGLGWPVVILTRRHATDLPRREVIGGVSVYRVGPAGAAHWKKWGLLFTAALALWRLRGVYDLIFVSGFRVVGITAVLLAKLLGKKVILKADSLGEMSGDFFTGGLARIGLRPGSLPFRVFLGLRNRILRRADRFVAISSVVAEELIEHGIPAEKIERIPNSVDNNRFHPVDQPTKLALRRQLGLPVEATIVIYTGRLVTYKGLPLLLRVWQDIAAQHENAYLLLVGSGGLDIDNCEAELRAYVSQHQLEERVCFTGSVTNVPDYLQASDIFVFPTENEAFGISLIEAMACGLAVVSTAVGGVKDIVENGRNGLIIQSGSYEQLSAALSRLLNNGPLCWQLGRIALHTVQTRYMTTSVNQHYIRLFNSMLNQYTQKQEPAVHD
jgi:glycosyltransferase involved in cell wall biosynthesis